MFKQDYGDKYDKVKWDFKEKGPYYYYDNYEYKCKNKESLYKLVFIRNKINKLCENILYDSSYIKRTIKNDEEIERINIFLNIHLEKNNDPRYLPDVLKLRTHNGQKVSRYLLSEIPYNCLFQGLNKPKMRYIEKYGLNVGPDKNSRAIYRDIFLKLDLKYDKLMELIIHELAHTMANHTHWRPDDHKKDFKWCENFIKKYWEY